MFWSWLSQLKEGCTAREVCWGVIQDEEAQTNDSLADAAHFPAESRRVVRGLGRKSREPEDGVESIHRHHNAGVGDLASSRVARGHGQVDPGGDGEEGLVGKRGIRQNPKFFIPKIKTPRQR